MIKCGAVISGSVGIDTSVANVWLALVITLLLLLITILEKKKQPHVCLNACASVYDGLQPHTKTHVCNLFRCVCVQYMWKYVV